LRRPGTGHRLCVLAEWRRLDMCWEWMERGRLEEAADEEARLIELEEEEQVTEPAREEEEELVPA
jgi:hypothetical protein